MQRGSSGPQKYRLAVTEDTLRHCQFFKGLPAADVESIAAFTLTKRIEKGDYLFHEGDKAEGFYIVQKGAINVHRVGAGGKEQVLRVFREGESFAEATLATEGGYPAEARATESSVVVLVPKIPFIGLLRGRPELALRMLGAMSIHLRTLVALVDDLTLKDMETRLATWLLRRCPQPLGDAPAVILLDQTKRVLAAEMGTTSETLSRTLAKFRDQDLLVIDGNVLTVTRPREMQKLLGRNLGEA